MPVVIPIDLRRSDSTVRIGELVLSDAPSPDSASMAFRYDPAWLTSGFALGADLPLKDGVQYPIDDPMTVDPVLARRNGLFGFFADHAPGEWVERLLTQARLNGLKLSEDEFAPTPSQLWMRTGHVSGRFSALALPLTPSNKTKFSPPLLEVDSAAKTVRSAKNLASALEAIAGSVSFKGLDLLEILAAGAMELGGHTPKCVVRLTRTGPEWVVRHSSVREPQRSALWTAVTRDLAQACGIDVVDGRLIGPRLYVERRFDRAADGTPHLCLSAATLVTRTTTTRRLLQPTPMTYLDIADVINCAGCDPKRDLKELFARLLFNTLTRNNRDRLDQFWFTPTPLGFKLLPMYRPCAQSAAGTGLLSTPIRPGVSRADPEAALSVARYFGLTSQAAKAMRLEFTHALANWKESADEYGADLLEKRQMAAVFES